MYTWMTDIRGGGEILKRVEGDSGNGEMAAAY